MCPACQSILQENGEMFRSFSVYIWWTTSYCFRNFYFQTHFKENVKEAFEMVNKLISENTQLAIRKLYIVMFLSYYPKDCLELITVTLLKWYFWCAWKWPPDGCTGFHNVIYTKSKNVESGFRAAFSLMISGNLWCINGKLTNFKIFVSTLSFQMTSKH